MYVKSSTFQLLIVFLLLGLLFGCAAKTVSSGNQAYINARLLFSVSYPEAWSSSLEEPDMGPYSDNSVAWNIEKENHHNGYLTLAIISLPKNGVMAGSRMATEVLKDIYPQITLNISESVHLPAGPAIAIQGYTPHQTFQVWIIDGSKNHYLLICASSPELFAEQVLQFEKIAQSFQVME